MQKKLKSNDHVLFLLRHRNGILIKEYPNGHSFVAYRIKDERKSTENNIVKRTVFALVPTTIFKKLVKKNLVKELKFLNKENKTKTFDITQKGTQLVRLSLMGNSTRAHFCSARNQL